MNEFAFKKKKKTQQELQQVNGPQGGMLPDAVSETIQRKRGSGTPLSDEQNKTYSSALGRNMSDVRIHSDAESDALSRSLNARAFTIGSDIFLSQGIDPARGGQDQATLTHEMTHVAQQNGQAGTGSLRLGAADTAQEHEAENAAAGNVHAGMSSHDTVQRGFFSYIGNKILGLFGARSAYNQYTRAQDKVKAAFEQLEPDDQAVFKNLKGQIAEAEKDVETKEAAANAAEQAFQEQTNAANAQSAQGGSVELDRSDLDSAVKNYEKSYSSYQRLRDQQLQMVKHFDGSITEADLDKYEGGKAKKFFTVLSNSGFGRSRFGSALLGLFGYKSNQGNQAAAQAQPANAGAIQDEADIDIHQEPDAQADAGNENVGRAHKTYSSDGKKQTLGKQVSVEGTVRNILTVKDQAEKLTNELLTEIGDEEHLQKIGISINDVKKQVLPTARNKVAEAMVPLLREAPEMEQLAAAQARKNEITQICANWEDPYKAALPLKNKYDAAYAVHDEISIQISDLRRKIYMIEKANAGQGGRRRREEDDYEEGELDESNLDGYKAEKERLENSAEFLQSTETIREWEHGDARQSYEGAKAAGIVDAMRDRDRDYNGSHMPIDLYIEDTENTLKARARTASYTDLIDCLKPEELKALKNSLRSLVTKTAHRMMKRKGRGARKAGAGPRNGSNYNERIKNKIQADTAVKDIIAEDNEEEEENVEPLPEAGNAPQAEPGQQSGIKIDDSDFKDIDDDFGDDEDDEVWVNHRVEAFEDDEDTEIETIWKRPGLNAPDDEGEEIIGESEVLWERPSEENVEQKGKQPDNDIDDDEDEEEKEFWEKYRIKDDDSDSDDEAIDDILLLRNCKEENDMPLGSFSGAEYRQSYQKLLSKKDARLGNQPVSRDKIIEEVWKQAQHDSIDVFKMVYKNQYEFKQALRTDEDLKAAMDYALTFNSLSEAVKKVYLAVSDKLVEYLKNEGDYNVH